MKKIYSIILTAVAALAIAPAASAQWTIADFIHGKYGNDKQLEFPNNLPVQYPEGKDFAYLKDISKPFSDGTYYIKLESFATGSAQVTEKPSDIVLVLDVSGSMRNNYGSTTGMYPFGSTGSTYNQGYCYSHFQPNAAMAGTSYKWNGKYYRIYSARDDHGSGTNPRYDYYIYFDDDNNQRHYLVGTGVVDTKPTDNHDQGNRVYWGPLWKNKNKSRLDELKEAVKEFIDIIQDNDLYYVDPNGVKRRRTNAQGQETSLGNRISIIKFAHSYWHNESNHLEVGNDVGAANTKAYNYTQLVINVTSVATDEGKQALYDAVDGLIEGGHTAADFGTELANEVLNQNTVKNRDSNKTVVLFTDGDPNHNDGFVTAVANSTIENANTSKVTHKATVFAVGVFETENDNRRDYMNRVSSNYTGATSMTTGTAITPASKRVYYQNAADGNLKQVFADIAKQAGGTEATLSAATSNVDIISNSFILPNGVNSTNIANYVKVFTAPLTYCNQETNTYTFGTETLAGHATDTYVVSDEDGNEVATYKVDEVHDPAYPNDLTKTVGINVALDGDNAIKVTNFDYSNNWCGPVEDQSHNITYRGHKIIILIPIQMNPNAIGGPNVETNGEGSGIFAKQGDQTAFVSFKSPTVSLPVNLFIEKSGLEGVESAKFMIERAIIPDGEDWTVDDIDEDAWEYVSTVFVTNSTNAKHNPDSNNPWVKVRGLPATKTVDGVQKGLIYRISEENWSWSYTGDEDPYQYTATGKVNNPFLFTNTKKDNGHIDVTIRHAESKVTNKFKPKTTGSTEGIVIYDDSKTNTRE